MALELLNGMVQVMCSANAISQCTSAPIIF